MSVVDAEDGLVEVEVDPDQRVLARAGAAARPAGAGAAEEGVHDVAEAAEAGAPAERAAAAAAAGVVRVAAQVDDPPLLRVGQHLVGAADLLELLLRPRVGVDVGVQVAGQLAVGALDVGVAGVPGQAQHAVVVGCHRSVLVLSSRPATGRRSGPRLVPRRCCLRSPSGWGRRRRGRRGPGHPSRTRRRRTRRRSSASCSFSSPMRTVTVLGPTCAINRRTTTCSSNASSSGRTVPGKSSALPRARLAVPADDQPVLGGLDQGLQQRGADRGDQAAQVRRRGLDQVGRPCRWPRPAWRR